jgi:carboxypeptidase C (cathepsin A)
LHLPTFAATAWYHKQVPAYIDLKTLLADCEEFALGTYMSALAKGDKITEAERNAIIDQLHKFTGLSKTYLDQTNLRLSVGRFNKELLRVQKRTVGRLDSRFTGIDYDAAGESYEYDPSYNTAIYGPYTTAINDYLRRTLGYENDIPYEILTGRVRPWSYSNVENQYLNVSETLRSAMSQNPSLHVWVANGYYDMATPYFATEYTFNHMFVDPSLKKNITMTYYEAGHMMYIHLESLKQFRRDFVTFMDKALVR